MGSTLGNSTGPHLHYEVYHTNSCSTAWNALTSADSVYAATSTEPIYGYNADGSLRATYYFNNFPPGGPSNSTTKYENFSFPGSTRLVDDGGAGFSTAGTWTTQQVGLDPVHRNSRDMRWVYNRLSGSTASASWLPSTGLSGRYTVYAFIPNNYATTTHAHYRVTYYDPGTGGHPTADVYVNQAIYYNRWVSLGTYCAQGDYPRVTLFNDTGEANGTKRVGADGMMWVRSSTSCALLSDPASEELGGDNLGPEVSPPSPQAVEISKDICWLAAQPPTDVVWQSYVGKFEVKGITLSYRLLYPASWFMYAEDDGPVQIQTFPQFETLDQAPPGFSVGGFSKIDVGFQTCISPNADCQLTGTPVNMAGLSGTAQTNPGGPAAPGLTIRSVALRKGDVILRFDAYMRGKPEEMAVYDQIPSYMLSTLSFDTGV